MSTYVLAKEMKQFFLNLHVQRVAESGQEGCGDINKKGDVFPWGLFLRKLLIIIQSDPQRHPSNWMMNVLQKEKKVFFQNAMWSESRIKLCMICESKMNRNTKQRGMYHLDTRHVNNENSSSCVTLLYFLELQSLATLLCSFSGPWTLFEKDRKKPVFFCRNRQIIGLNNLSISVISFSTFCQTDKLSKPHLHIQRIFLPTWKDCEWPFMYICCRIKWACGASAVGGHSCIFGTLFPFVWHPRKEFYRNFWI